MNPNQLNEVQRFAASKGRNPVDPVNTNDFESAGIARSTSGGGGTALQTKDQSNQSQTGGGSGGVTKSSTANGGGSGGGGSEPINPSQGTTQSGCFKLGTRTEGKIVETFKYYGLFSLVKLELRDGKTVLTTNDHRFAVKFGRKIIWIPVKDLRIADRLVTKEGSSLLVSKRFGGFTWRVFNHETEDHVFYANGFLVHNVKTVI